MKFETISVIGLGYIGLPTAAVFAARGIKVIGVDVNLRAVETINQGRIHIIEPELDIAVRSAVTGGYLRATTTPEPADAFLIAVPTPFTSGHQPDLAYVEAAARSIAPVLKRGNLVVLESTSPVGTTELIGRILAELRPDLTFPQQRGEASDVRVAHCPERVLPGHIMRELIQNDRVVGGMTPACAEQAAALYRIFLTGECLLTDSRTAEMCKLTENSFRDVNIAFANELSMVCDKLSINVWELIKLANRHPRVNILQPGPGVGGHCIAVDPWFIVASAPEQAQLIRTAREVNDSKPHHVLSQVEAARAHRTDATIACLGLAFKADIDDLRESPALEIVNILAAQSNAPLLVAEPHVEVLPPTLSRHAHVRLTSPREAIAGADIVLLLVNHKAFDSIDRATLRQKTVIDTRGIWS